ncbi:MAG: type II toxin-antitoxin system HicA family toxin [Caulobacteraceae bacterium]|nr:MAG: type II toxin-antitoxin system HicA family toxin [Caulobacteraceae bacterium]
MKSAEVIAILEADGWRRVTQKGSHVQLKHPSKPGRVTVPHPSKDLKIGTLKSIERQSGLSFRRK